MGLEISLFGKAWRNGEREKNATELACWRGRRDIHDVFVSVLTGTLPSSGDRIDVPNGALLSILLRINSAPVPPGRGERYELVLSDQRRDDIAAILNAIQWINNHPKGRVFYTASW